jgi:hypothetical protein
VQDGEFWRGSEDCHQGHEVAVPECAFCFGADEQHPVFPVNEPPLDQVVRDRSGRNGQLRQSKPLLPQLLTDSPFLQAQREQLLGDDVPGLGRRGHRFDEAAAPGQEETGCAQQLLFFYGEEQAVPLGAGAPPAAAEALQEPRNGDRGIYLEDPIQVTDIYPEFQGRCGHDDAVPALGERLLCPASLIQGERCVHEMCGDPTLSELGAEKFDVPLGVAEHQALLAPVQGCDNFRRVAQRADIIQLHVGLRGRGKGNTSPLVFWGNDQSFALPCRRALQPAQQFIRVADRRGQPDALQGAATDTGQPLKNSQHVPAAVAASEGVHLVHNYRAQVGEQLVVVDACAHQHRLK